ncbi:hypothetical protein HOG98_02835 [bacterium]|jgi:hypothetical protein|nr:hypothetical protein [bacterium]
MLDSEALKYLDDYVLKNDPKSFLRRYFDYVAAGKNLGIPETTGSEGLNSWLVFLHGISSNISKEFLDGLMTVWDDIVEKTGSLPSSDNVYLYLNLLDDKPLDFPNRPTDGLDPGYIYGQVDEQEDANKKLNLPGISISGVYQKTPSVKNQNTLELSKVQDKIKKSISKSDAAAVIANSLSLREYMDKIPIPKSTALGKIKREWVAICLSDYDKKISDTFQDLLANKWYSSIMKYTYPLTKDDYQLFLLKFLADEKIDLD